MGGTNHLGPRSPIRTSDLEEQIARNPELSTSGRLRPRGTKQIFQEQIDSGSCFRPRPPPPDLSPSEFRASSLPPYILTSQGEDGRQEYDIPHVGGGVELKPWRLRKAKTFLAQEQRRKDVPAQKCIFCPEAYTPYSGRSWSIYPPYSAAKAHRPGSPPGNVACWGIMKNDEVRYFAAK